MDENSNRSILILESENSTLNLYPEIPQELSRNSTCDEIANSETAKKELSRHATYNKIANSETPKKELSRHATYNKIANSETPKKELSRHATYNKIANSADFLEEKETEHNKKLADICEQNESSNERISETTIVQNEAGFSESLSKIEQSGNYQAIQSINEETQNEGEEKGKKLRSRENLIEDLQSTNVETLNGFENNQNTIQIRSPRFVNSPSWGFVVTDQQPDLVITNNKNQASNETAKTKDQNIKNLTEPNPNQNYSSEKTSAKNVENSHGDHSKTSTGESIRPINVSRTRSIVLVDRAVSPFLPGQVSDSCGAENGNNDGDRFSLGPPPPPLMIGNEGLIGGEATAPTSEDDLSPPQYSQ